MIVVLRALVRLLLLCQIALIGQAVQAQVRPAQEPVVIVTSDDGAAYMEAAQATMTELLRLGLPRYDIRQMTAAEFDDAAAAGKLPQPRVYLALGSLAADLLSRDVVGGTAAPVLCALLPRSSFERIVRQRNPKLTQRFSAIYLDQPLRRQLALMRLVWPQAQRLGVLWGTESMARAPALRAMAQPMGWSLVEAQADAVGGLFPAIKQVVNDSDVMLALPDAQVYNSSSIRNILMAAMRQQVPVVAFSPAYVRAGAVLALYQTPAQAGLQAATVLHDVLHNKAWPATPLESFDFEIDVNAYVANALNLKLDVPALRQALRRQESLP